MDEINKIVDRGSANHHGKQGEADNSGVDFSSEQKADRLIMGDTNLRIIDSVESRREWCDTGVPAPGEEQYSIEQQTKTLWAVSNSDF